MASQKASKSKRAKPRRTNSFRSQFRRNTGRTLALPRKLSPLARLVHTLQQEGIRFQIAGMSAAILQGVPSTTLDTDIWVDLKERQYLRVLQLCKKQGAEILAPTAVALSDDSLINFLYRVDGLKSFDIEWKRSRRLKWFGTIVHVLPLERIIQSKEKVRRPKDLAHLPLLKQVLKLTRKWVK
jgi:hypothetical protein